MDMRRIMDVLDHWRSRLPKAFLDELASVFNQTNATHPERAGAFCEWYADTHLRLVGVGYIGNPRGDYESALRMVSKFTDAELRDAAIVWFGQDDDFATRGTRSIPKFASRVSDCVRVARTVRVRTA